MHSTEEPVVLGLLDVGCVGEADIGWAGETEVEGREPPLTEPPVRRQVRVRVKISPGGPELVGKRRPEGKPVEGRHSTGPHISGEAACQDIQPRVFSDTGRHGGRRWSEPGEGGRTG